MSSKQTFKLKSDKILNNFFLINLYVFILKQIKICKKTHKLFDTSSFS